ncbi:MAG TPA: cytochrome c [Candidatus Acidoferrales bacterium]|nr:cytochrome c [Candidatus Acidoferrales bacterium]
MWRYLLVLSILLFAAFASGAGQEQKPAENAAPAEAKAPPEAVAQPNPVKPTAESLAQGKKVYGYDCAMCHGVEGDGKGDLATDMKLQLADYRDPASLKDKTDGELFYIIQKGKGDMPQEGSRAKPNEIWNLVNYVRSFAKKGAPPKDKPASP